MRCCAADAVPLDAYIVIDPDASVPDWRVEAVQGKWVEVKGQVQFRSRQRNGQEEFVSVIYVRPDKDHALSELIRVLPKNEEPSPFLTESLPAGGPRM
jgi:hypothetical protein